MPNGMPRPKVMAVIEEVHIFVSRSNASEMRLVLDSLQIISSRGRKRWISLTLVSHQPGHVPDELFELANTRFIHQLKSVANLSPVKQTTGGVHEALWGSLSFWTWTMYGYGSTIQECFICRNETCKIKKGNDELINVGIRESV